MATRIIVGIGSNLPGPEGRGPRWTCENAVRQLGSDSGLSFVSVSHYYRTAPVPASDQPDYCNAVAVFEGALSPDATLTLLHQIEADAGRVRNLPNAARTLDLDLLAWGDVVCDRPDLILPHPRLHQRAFVLYPLCDVVPDWRHPLLGRTASSLRDALPPQRIERDLP